MAKTPNNQNQLEHHLAPTKAKCATNSLSVAQKLQFKRNERSFRRKPEKTPNKGEIRKGGFHGPEKS